MFSRTSSPLLLLTLAACSSEAGDQGTGGGLFGKAEVPAEQVPCALADAKTFTSACTVERVNQDGKAIIVVHHPDGGFRRLVAVDDGKSYAAVDGSDEVAIEANGKEVEVTVAGDHYLFPAPATAGSNAPHP